MVRRSFVCCILVSVEFCTDRTWNCNRRISSTWRKSRNPKKRRQWMSNTEKKWTEVVMVHNQRIETVCSTSVQAWSYPVQCVYPYLRWSCAFCVCARPAYSVAKYVFNSIYNHYVHNWLKYRCIFVSLSLSPFCFIASSFLSDVLFCLFSVSPLLGFLSLSHSLLVSLCRSRLVVTVHFAMASWALQHQLVPCHT